MPSELSLKASGHLVLAGDTGSVYHHHGQILITRAAIKGIDSSLLRILEAAVDEMEIVIEIDSIDTGTHTEHSRHGHGCAADIDHIYLIGQPRQVANLANHEARRLVVWLIEKGFHAGHEAGDYPAILFGPVGTKWNRTQKSHSGHAHVSLYPLAGE